MRIAFYAPLKPPDHSVASGDRAMARGVIAALRMRGHQVEVVSHFRSYDRGDADRQERIRRVGNRLAERLVRRFQKRSAAPGLWFTYHLYHKAPDWLGPAISTALGIPYFVAEASFAPKQSGGPWALGHLAVADAIGHADRILQPNPADAECVLPLLKSADRMILIPPFLETAPYREGDPSDSRDAVSAMLNLDTDAPWLLTVAMMRDDQKLLSYRCLAGALTRLCDMEWRLVIAGDGPATAMVHKLFEPFGDRVRWVGIVEPERLRQLYRAADIFVWPAIKEAYGMALMEAQASGLPVVAGNGGGVPGIVADGETGLLVPEGDAEAFAAAVGALLSDPARRRDMGAAAAKRSASRHDIVAAADLLDREIRAAVKARR